MPSWVYTEWVPMGKGYATLTYILDIISESENNTRRGVKLREMVDL